VGKALRDNMLWKNGDSSDASLDSASN
jgi:hypothetical protein